MAYIIRTALVSGMREDGLLTLKRDAINHDRKAVIDKGNKLRVVGLKPIAGYDLFASIPAFVGKPHCSGAPRTSASARTASGR